MGFPDECDALKLQRKCLYFRAILIYYIVLTSTAKHLIGHFLKLCSFFVTIFIFVILHDSWFYVNKERNFKINAPDLCTILAVSFMASCLMFHYYRRCVISWRVIILFSKMCMLYFLV